MKLWFLPFVREGLQPLASTTLRAHTDVAVRLSANGQPTRDVSRRLELLGPGDILSINARQVLRMTPTPAARDAEPDFFPSVEFDAPDLPWAYSPMRPEGARLLPWIALVVIEDQPGVALERGERGQAPWLLRMPADVARRELPDLRDAWAWAHVQVACGTQGEIASTLAQQPDRTLARLLAARRLRPYRRYHACVVPVFRAGLVAGLGGRPESDATVRSGRELAWDAARVPRQVPVYHTWTFRTGEAGDFEALAQQLRPTPLDASVPPAPLRLDLPDGDDALAVDWEAPLQLMGSGPTRNRRPPAATTDIRAALRAGSSDAAVLGPSYYGSSWVDERTLEPLSNWAPELNLTPMWRAAAGLGADIVRGEQESLVSAASEQLEAHRREQREGRRRQFAATVVNRVKLRLATAPKPERARVLAPVLARQQAGAADVGLFSSAGRRVERNTWRGSIRQALLDNVLTPTDGTLTRDVSRTLPIHDIVPAPGDVVAREVPESIAEINYRVGVVKPRVNVDAAPVTPVDPTAIPEGAFAPRFDRPLSEPLAARSPELMLPTQEIPGNGVLLVESNPRFVEAFLVGANQELNLELLWRGLPADRRATPFRRFWGYDAGTTVADIDPVTSWLADSALGAHVKTTPAMVLLVRGELVRRYPSLIVSMVPAKWNTDGSRSPVDQGLPLLPSFRGRIGADVLYAGFAQPSLADAAGTPKAPGIAGWFVMLSENEGDPRFGLDPDAQPGPPTRRTLSWVHLGAGFTGAYAPVDSFPAVADALFTPALATAASFANLTRQRQFRVFLHASLLVRP